MTLCWSVSLFGGFGASRDCALPAARRHAVRGQPVFLMSAANLRLVRRSGIAGLVLLVGSTWAVASPSSAENLAPVFRQVDPAVVVVRTTERTVLRRSNGRQVSVEGLGSGVLVSADGKVVTAAHVVQTADTVIVEFADQGPVAAEVIASEPAADVALLQVQRDPGWLEARKARRLRQRADR